MVSVGKRLWLCWMNVTAWISHWLRLIRLFTDWEKVQMNRLLLMWIQCLLQKRISLKPVGLKMVFLSENDFMRAEEESQRMVESFRDSLGRKKGFWFWILSSEIVDPLLEIVGYLQLPTVPYGLVNALRPRNKLRPRSPFSDKKNIGNRTYPGWMVWNSALCTCAHTHACRKNIACAFLAGFRVVCCLFYRFPVRNALRASQAVHARDVMVNGFWGVSENSSFDAILSR